MFFNYEEMKVKPIIVNQHTDQESELGGSVEAQKLKVIVLLTVTF